MQRTIYIADDVPSNIQLVEDIFSRDASLTLKNAGDGQKLMDLIESDGFPDLIILDLMMPVMNGFDVLTNLKEKRDKDYFPIIVVSGLSEQKNVMDALSIGADDYLVKPFYMDELKLKVYNMLKLKERIG